MPFEHSLTVRFDEIDRAGIAYFGDVLKYCHHAYEELMAKVVGDLEAWFAAADWGMPLVHCEADYKRPNAFGDRLTIELDVSRMGKSSVTFAYRVTCGDELRATVQLVHAFVDLQSFAPIPAPQAFMDGIRRVGLLPERHD